MWHINKIELSNARLLWFRLQFDADMNMISHKITAVDQSKSCKSVCELWKIGREEMSKAIATNIARSFDSVIQLDIYYLAKQRISISKRNTHIAYEFLFHIWTVKNVYVGSLEWWFSTNPRFRLTEWILLCFFSIQVDAFQVSQVHTWNISSSATKHSAMFSRFHALVYFGCFYSIAFFRLFLKHICVLYI